MLMGLCMGYVLCIVYSNGLKLQKVCDQKALGIEDKNFLTAKNRQSFMGSVNGSLFFCLVFFHGSGCLKNHLQFEKLLNG